MRLFEREANLISHYAYLNFLEYRRLWDEVIALESDIDFDCPEANQCLTRAQNQFDFARFLDPQGDYSFWRRYRIENGHLYK